MYVYVPHPNGWGGISLWTWFAFPLCQVFLWSCLLAICYLLSSLKKCLFKSFAHFWISLFFLLLLLSFVIEFSIYLDINLLSDTWFTNIFCHYVGCLFTLLSVSFGKEFFLIFMKSNDLFFFCCLSLVSLSRNCCQIHCHEVFPQVFL